MTGGKGIAERFRTWFGVNPHVYRAPGRVNLIGEHTDYGMCCGIMDQFISLRGRESCLDARLPLATV
jgi:galactokinase